MASEDRQLPQEGRFTRWGKQGFKKSIKVSDWISPYANAVSAKVGGERFWPQSDDMPLEIEKCERILRAFTVEGVAQKEEKEEKVKDAKGNWIQKKVRVLRKIPPAAIRNAKGIVIFSTMRSGIAPFGGGGGTGLVMARLPNGSWSAPSAVSPQNLSAGLLIGVDFMDCILLINSDVALKSFMSHRVDVGAETGLTAGPYGSGMSAEAGLDRAPIYSYVRTRGAYAGVEIMGQVFFHRFDENERFYYAPHISAKDILSGKVRIPPVVYPLHRALRDAETGRAQGGKLERTEFDLIKLPENEVFSQLGPRHANSKRRFVAGMPSSPSVSSVPSVPQTPRQGVASSRTSLESLEPESANGTEAVEASAKHNGSADGSQTDEQPTAEAGLLIDYDEEEPEFVKEGEKLRLPPTPEELEMMEAAGVMDDEDLRQAKEDRKQIYSLPPPPMHVKVKKYWDIHPNLAMRRPTKQLVMDGPYPETLRDAQLTPLPTSPPMGDLIALDDANAHAAESKVGNASLSTEQPLSIEGQKDAEGTTIATGLSEAEADEALRAAKDGVEIESIQEPTSDAFEGEREDNGSDPEKAGQDDEEAEFHETPEAMGIDDSGAAVTDDGRRPQRPPRRKR